LILPPPRDAADMPSETLHIVFSPSAAADLREALRQTGRDDEVVAMFDDLSFGPIAPGDPATRARWIEDELGYEGWEEVGAEMDAFWTRTLEHRGRRVAWPSRRSANDYAGYLELLWRLGDAPCEIVDMTDAVVAPSQDDDDEIEVAPPRPVICLSLLPAWRIVSCGFLDRAKPLDDAARDAYHSQWGRLREENAPLRVIENGTLVSAPLTYFDERLLSGAQPMWRKAARVVAEAMMVDHDDELHQVGDLVLGARLADLAEAGRLEWRGYLPQMRFYEVRLPKTRS